MAYNTEKPFQELVAPIPSILESLGELVKESPSYPINNGINGLNITSISVYPVNNGEGKLKALVRAVLNDSLQLSGLKIYEDVDGCFVSYPVEFAQQSDTYRQCFYPTTEALKVYIEDVILTEYRNALKRIA